MKNKLLTTICFILIGSMLLFTTGCSEEAKETTAATDTQKQTEKKTKKEKKTETGKKTDMPMIAGQTKTDPVLPAKYQKRLR